MKIQYRREEGGFAQVIDGRPVAIFRIKGWMNNLRDYNGLDTKRMAVKIPGFAKTQFEYHGIWE